jgi:hypothetical protein
VVAGTPFRVAKARRRRRIGELRRWGKPSRISACASRHRSVTLMARCCAYTRGSAQCALGVRDRTIALDKFLYAPPDIRDRGYRASLAWAHHECAAAPFLAPRPAPPGDRLPHLRSSPVAPTPPHATAGAAHRETGPAPRGPLLRRRRRRAQIRAHQPAGRGGHGAGTSPAHEPAVRRLAAWRSWRSLAADSAHGAGRSRSNAAAGSVPGCAAPRQACWSSIVTASRPRRGERHGTRPGARASRSRAAPRPPRRRGPPGASRDQRCPATGR